MKPRNYAAEMAKFLETYASQPATETDNPSLLLASLTEMVRQGVPGAIQALVQQLRPCLISLAQDLKPEDPQDIITSLYLAVLRGKSALTYLETDICTAYRTQWRINRRLKKKLNELSQEHPQHLLPSTPGDVSVLAKYLSPEDQFLWKGSADGLTAADLAAALGWSIAKATKRWQELSDALKDTIETEEEIYR
jgi:hypothetical protein